MNAEEIYLSLLGELVNPLPGVENAFAPGKPCQQLYAQVYDANCRLCQRLGVQEDADVECIIDCFFQINRILCLQIYQLGADGFAVHLVQK